MGRLLPQVSALHILQPSRSARRTTSAGQSSFTRIRDPSDQRVRTGIVFDARNIKLGRRQPQQRHGYIAGPDAPCRTVAEFYDVTLVVLLDLHCSLQMSA
jgi:hypothetical protein